MTAPTFAEALPALLDKLSDVWSKSLTLDTGERVRVRMAYDSDTTLDSWDSYGRIEYRDYDEQRDPRPSWCDGGARKVTGGRSGFFWWQPDADLLKPEAVVALRDIESVIRGYLREEWTYIGLLLEVTGPACSHGYSPEPDIESLWGIESNGDHAAFTEIFLDLYATAREHIDN